MNTHPRGGKPAVAESSDYRVIEWWPNKDQRNIVALLRTPETDAMTDEELIADFGKWKSRRNLRVVDDE
jgi:hypothetical protein